jgi:hypothetical protein
MIMSSAPQLYAISVNFCCWKTIMSSQLAFRSQQKVIKWNSTDVGRVRAGHIRASPVHFVEPCFIGPVRGLTPAWSPRTP